MSDTALAAAVIQRAVDDLSSLKEVERREARSFLTDEHGACAQSRKLWCDLAGFDADAVRERVLRRLDA